MKKSKIKYLRKELKNECISYEEIFEIETEALRLGINVEGMMASDLLDEIENISGNYDPNDLGSVDADYDCKNK